MTAILALSWDGASLATLQLTTEHLITRLKDASRSKATLKMAQLSVLAVKPAASNAHRLVFA